MAKRNSLLWFVSFLSRSSSTLQPEQLLRIEKGLYTVRPSESMTRTMWLRLEMSIPTINIANTILLKFTDSPRDLMSHILLRDERRAAAPASGSTMNPHKIEVPCCTSGLTPQG